jgi:hypothetical protein
VSALRAGPAVLVASTPVPRLRFRLPLLVLAVFGLVAGACTDEGELGGPNVGGSLAATVGSFDYTTGDLQDEVEQWAINPLFLGQVLQIADVGVEGRRSADLVAFVLSHRVITAQARQLAAATGFEPTDADVVAILEQLDQAFPAPGTGGPLFQVYDDEFRRQLAVDFLFQQHLSTLDPSTLDVPEVQINPRYGSFVDEDRGLGRVVPPSGPALAPLPILP